jgi:hypothetical protein
MSLEDLEIDLLAMVTAFQLTAKKVSVVKDISVQFVIEEFGTVICGINRIDYIEVKKVIDTHFSGYRVVYITTNDDMSTKRYEVLWELMTGGYMRWLRYEFPSTFKNTLINWGLSSKIINERLRRFNGREKYKYLIGQNEWALRSSENYVLSVDPGFFDMMIELGD